MAQGDRLPRSYPHPEHFCKTRKASFRTVPDRFAHARRYSCPGYLERGGCLSLRKADKVKSISSRIHCIQLQYGISFNHYLLVDYYCWPRLVCSFYLAALPRMISIALIILGIAGLKLTA